MTAAEKIAALERECERLEAENVRLAGDNAIFVRATQERTRTLRDITQALSLPPDSPAERVLTAVRDAAKDTRRLDWLERYSEGCAWKHQSWICRGRFSAPKLVCTQVGERFSEGPTQANARGAIDSGMGRYPDPPQGER